MSMILKVAARFIAFGHPSEEALKKYLHDHPNADPSNHYVDDSAKEDDYKKDVDRGSKDEKAKDQRLLKDLDHLSRDSIGRNTPMGGVLKALHKNEKLPPKLLEKALRDLKIRGDSADHPEARKNYKEMHKKLKTLTDNYKHKDK